jgi:hypothetical protein
MGHPPDELFKSVSLGIGLDNITRSTFKTTVWEDNMGCLKLAKLAPGQYTPRSKHDAVKYNWFRSKLQEKGYNQAYQVKITKSGPTHEGSTGANFQGDSKAPDGMVKEISSGRFIREGVSR